MTRCARIAASNALKWNIMDQSATYIGIELLGQRKRKNDRKNLMIKEWVLSPIRQYQWSLKSKNKKKKRKNERKDLMIKEWVLSPI